MNFVILYAQRSGDALVDYASTAQASTTDERYDPTTTKSISDNPSWVDMRIRQRDVHSWCVVRT
ncbi:MAG: hypothetical protein RI513_00095 [Balneolaceae bacterium]|nr:hypothetical protein [Balneolaceae bacterium]